MKASLPSPSRRPPQQRTGRNGHAVRLHGASLQLKTLREVTSPATEDLMTISCGSELLGPSEENYVHMMDSTYFQSKKEKREEKQASFCLGMVWKSHEGTCSWALCSCTCLRTDFSFARRWKETAFCHLHPKQPSRLKCNQRLLPSLVPEARVTAALVQGFNPPGS